MSKAKSATWQQELDKLKNYCNKKGYSVSLTDNHQDAIYFRKKKIVINKSHSDEIALYYLLHEMGHHVVANKKSYFNKYQDVYNDFSKNSVTHKLTIIQEEFDAWNEGLRLATRLNIKVNRRKYEITKSKCVCTYLTWVKNKQ